jgi:hypothetical protein
MTNNQIISEKFFAFDQITFNSEVKVIWDYEKQATVRKNVLSYLADGRMHGSWLNESVLSHFQKMKNRDIFIYCDSNKFSFYEENLLEVLNILEGIFLENTIEND